METRVLCEGFPLLRLACALGHSTPRATRCTRQRHLKSKLVARIFKRIVLKFNRSFVFHAWYHILWYNLLCPIMCLSWLPSSKLLRVCALYQQPSHTFSSPLGQGPCRSGKTQYLGDSSILASKHPTTASVARREQRRRYILSKIEGCPGSVSTLSLVPQKVF